MEAWQKIDDSHSHCAECSGVYRTAQLDEGLCSDCSPVVKARANKVVARAGEKTTNRAMKASAQLLASIREQGKTGKSMPMVMDTFLAEMGGEGGYAKRLATEFKKAHGEGLSSAELETFEYSSATTLKWFELINRSMLATDSGKDMDIGSLEESDLEAIVAKIARRAVLEDVELRRLALMNAIDSDKEFRMVAFEAIMKADPSLENGILAKNGVITVEAAKIKAAECNKEEDDYDPTKDEWQEDE